MLGLIDGSAGSQPISSGVSVDELSKVITRLADNPGLTSPDTDNLERNVARIDRIAVLERMKNACAAAQARLSADLLTDRLAAERAATATTARASDPDQVRRGVTAEIAFARRQSPARARKMLGLAHALTTEMPCTLAALADGTTSEYRAQLVAAEFGCLSSRDRIAADREIGPKLAWLGDLRSRHAAAGIAGRLDPEAVLAKIRGAVADRRVSIRPAQDTMVRLSALLPLAPGMSAFCALRRAADLDRAEGDDRSHDQFMADELVSRLTNPPAGAANGMTADISVPADPPAGAPDPAESDTSAGSGPAAGPASAESPTVTGCDAYGAAYSPGGAIDLHLVMTDRALLDDDDTPAHVSGYGPIPSALARHLVAGADAVNVFLRRLFTDPETRQLVAMDSRAREFPEGARRLLIARDQICRTPWCDAPIQHIDHITPAARGGPTAIGNGQGLCANCNYTKEFPDWTVRMHDDGTIVSTTPTGNTASSPPPALPSSEPWNQAPDRREASSITVA